MLLNTGAAVLVEAIPAPIAGCKIKSGASTVTIPMKSAGNKDGDLAQSRPKLESSRALNAIPIE
jgi:hypothetical protein